jgi:predicted RecB family endonuclease
MIIVIKKEENVTQEMENVNVSTVQLKDFGLDQVVMNVNRTTTQTQTVQLVMQVLTSTKTVNNVLKENLVHFVTQLVSAIQKEENVTLTEIVFVQAMQWKDFGLVKVVMNAREILTSTEIVKLVWTDLIFQNNV